VIIKISDHTLSQAGTDLNCGCRSKSMSWKLLPLNLTVPGEKEVHFRIVYYYYEKNICNVMNVQIGIKCI